MDINNKKHDGMILIITSFSQLYNFFSYFNEKKLIQNKKVYLTIFSDLIPSELILELKQYIEKYASVEILDMRRTKLNISLLNIYILRVFFYYFLIIKKIFQLKKTFIISHILVSGRMQIPILLLMFFFSKSKIFFAEDGVGEYVPYANSEKKPIFFFFLKKFLKINNFRIHILQLSNSRNDYFRILNQPFLKDDNFIKNITMYRNFLKNDQKNTYLLKPKCIIIGTLPSTSFTIGNIEDLYIATVNEINKKYSYNSNEIFFFPHPRIEASHNEKLIKSLSNYLIVQKPSSIIVESYLVDESVELVVGSLSTALYYAKVLFNKKETFYLDHSQSSKKKDKDKNFLNFFKKVGIKSFLN